MLNIWTIQCPNSTFDNDDDDGFQRKERQKIQINNQNQVHGGIFNPFIGVPKNPYQ